MQTSTLSTVNLIYADCKELVKKLPKWAKPEIAETDFLWAATRPKILKEPKGAHAYASVAVAASIGR
jgi:hypothetical protein